MNGQEKEKSGAKERRRAAWRRKKKEEMRQYREPFGFERAEKTKTEGNMESREKKESLEDRKGRLDGPLEKGRRKHRDPRVGERRAERGRGRKMESVEK